MSDVKALHDTALKFARAAFPLEQTRVKRKELTWHKVEQVIKQAMAEVIFQQSEQCYSKAARYYGIHRNTIRSYRESWQPQKD